jgi:hypothetical protein
MAYMLPEGIHQTKNCFYDHNQSIIIDGEVFSSQLIERVNIQDNDNKYRNYYIVRRGGLHRYRFTNFMDAVNCSRAQNKGDENWLKLAQHPVYA